MLRNTWHGWLRLHSPRHMDGILVFGLSVTRLCLFVKRMCASLLGRGRMNIFKTFITSM